MSDKNVIEMEASCNGSGSTVIKINVTCTCEKQQAVPQPQKTVSSTSDGGSPSIVGTPVKFAPLHEEDLHKLGTQNPDLTRYQNISCMEAYRHKSPEELRFEDYSMYKKSFQNTSVVNNSFFREFRWSSENNAQTNIGVSGPTIQGSSSAQTSGGFQRTPENSSVFAQARYEPAVKISSSAQTNGGFQRPPENTSSFAQENRRGLETAVKVIPQTSTDSNIQVPYEKSYAEAWRRIETGPTVKKSCSGFQFPSDRPFAQSNIGRVWPTENHFSGFQCPPENNRPFAQANIGRVWPSENHFSGFQGPTENNGFFGQKMVNIPPWHPEERANRHTDSSVPTKIKIHLRGAGGPGSRDQLGVATNTAERIFAKPSTSNADSMTSPKIHFKCTCGLEAFFSEPSGPSKIYYKCTCGMETSFSAPTRAKSASHKPAFGENQNASCPGDAPPKQKSSLRELFSRHLARSDSSNGVKVTHGSTAPAPPRISRYELGNFHSPSWYWTPPLFGYPAPTIASLPVIGSSTSSTATTSANSVSTVGSTFGSSTSSATTSANSVPTPGSTFGSTTTSATTSANSVPTPGSLFGHCTPSTTPMFSRFAPTTASTIGSSPSFNAPSSTTTSPKIFDLCKRTTSANSLPTSGSTLGHCTPFTAPVVTFAPTIANVFGSALPLYSVALANSSRTHGTTVGSSTSSATTSAHSVPTPGSICGLPTPTTIPVISSFAPTTSIVIDDSSWLTASPMIVPPYGTELAQSKSSMAPRCGKSAVNSLPSSESIHCSSALSAAASAVEPFGSPVIHTSTTSSAATVGNSSHTPGSVHSSCAPSIATLCGNIAPVYGNAFSSTVDVRAASSATGCGNPTVFAGSNTANTTGGIAISGTIPPSAPNLATVQAVKSAKSKIIDVALLAKTVWQIRNKETSNAVFSGNEDATSPLKDSLQTSERLTDSTLGNKSERQATETDALITRLYAVFIIQRHWRAFQAARKVRKDFLALKSAAVVFQRAWRKKKKKILYIEIEDGFVDVREENGLIFLYPRPQDHTYYRRTPWGENISHSNCDI